MDKMNYYPVKRKYKEPVLKQNTKNNVEYLTFPLLEETGVVKHLFSTRLGGVSTGIYESMNLSTTSDDSWDNVYENYARIANTLEEPIEHIVRSNQTHTTNVRVVTENDWGKGVAKPLDYKNVDGMVTNVPGTILATTYADCVPLFFVDPVKKAIGLSHSGWRGTVGRIGKVTIETMASEYGSNPEDIICAIGPSICQDCYEVSCDVAEAFFEEFAGHKLDNSLCYPTKEGKYQLNLWRANEIVMLEAGIKKEHIQITDLCTCCNSDYLFSHRATQGKRGLLAAFLMLKDEI